MKTPSHIGRPDAFQATALSGGSTLALAFANLAVTCGGLRCDRFDEAAALPAKVREHRSHDGFHFDAETVRTLPFGCEYALDRAVDLYDGGARRYEIPEHYKEVTEYWESLLAAAPNVDFKAFLAEKIGYARPITYEAWRQLNGYQQLDVQKLFELEQHYLDIVQERRLEDICRRRLAEIKANLAKYVDSTTT